jgi:glutamate synthase domain-containing protein 3
LPSHQQEAEDLQTAWHLGQTDEALLRQLIQNHHRWTGSLKARDILDHWADSRAQFIKVFPNDYRRALREIQTVQQTVDTPHKAKADSLQSQGGKRSEALGARADCR